MRKLLTKADILIVVIVLLLAGILYFAIFKTPGQKAVVKYQGKTVEEINLADDSYYETKVNDVLIVRENNEIYVKESNCPDKLCVRAGHLTHSGQTAVCVPNRVSVTIEGQSDGPQAVTG